MLFWFFWLCAKIFYVKGAGEGSGSQGNVSFPCAGGNTVVVVLLVMREIFKKKVPEMGAFICGDQRNISSPSPQGRGGGAAALTFF
jgi:hypothetical protein